MTHQSLIRELVYAGLLPWPLKDIHRCAECLNANKMDFWLFSKWIARNCVSKSIKPSAFPIQAWANMYIEWNRGSTD